MTASIHHRQQAASRSLSGRDHRARIAADLRRSPRLLDVHTLGGRYLCSRLTPNGGWVAVTGPDGVTVQEVRTGHPLGPSLALDESVSRGALGADGELFAGIGSDTVRVWDVPTGRSRVVPLPPLAVSLFSGWVAFPSGGRVLLTKDTSSSPVRLWDLATDVSTALKTPWTNLVMTTTCVSEVSCHPVFRWHETGAQIARVTWACRVE